MCENHKIAQLGETLKVNRHCLRVEEMMFNCCIFFENSKYAEIVLPYILAYGESFCIFKYPYFEFPKSGCFSRRKI